jgi:AcrR family transcriptional regulator
MSLSVSAEAETASALGARGRHLVDVAAHVFAERGFHGATVREICQGAGANVAAVNYHFGGKDGLYAAVLRQTHRFAHEQYPLFGRAAADAAPAERLKEFVRSFLLRILAEGRHALYGKLLSREMIEPTRALDGLVENEIRPMSEQLHGIMRELLGPDSSDEQVRLCGMSVVSQVLFYHHCRPVLCRVYPRLSFGPAEVEGLVEHITRFSLAGLRALAKAAPRRAATVPPRPGKPTSRARGRRVSRRSRRTGD